MSVEFNRRDPADIVDSGSMQVPWNAQVRIGFPLKETGTIEEETPSPAYTKMTKVEEYTDTTGVEACVGVSEDQVPNGATVEAGSLRNIEFRHLRRDVAVCKFGVRRMKNIGAVTLTTGMKVAPAVGGVQAWIDGMADLGTVKRGPIVQNDFGEIIVDVRHVYVVPPP